MTLKKTLSMAAMISAGLVMAGLSTGATATEHTKKKHHHHHAPTDRQLIRADEKHLARDDARIANLETEVGDLRAQLATQKQASDAMEAKEAQLETQVAAEAAKENAKNDMVFFRGGFASLTENRHNELLTSDQAFNANGFGSNSGNGNGWYVGAGFDHRLTDDLWGATDLVAVDAELMFNYQNYGQSYNAFVSNTLSVASGYPVKATAQITQLTLSASPKVKFNLMDGNFRPWVVPFGLAINVVSPPSSGVTVLNPGLMLGTGAEYRIWKDLWAGVDFRYQFTGGDLNYRIPYGNGAELNQTPTQGLMAGGYIGVGF